MIRYNVGRSSGEDFTPLTADYWQVVPLRGDLFLHAHREGARGEKNGYN